MPDSSTPLDQRVLIARAILSTSPVTRLALACQSEQLREYAADELADKIAATLNIPSNQLPLAL